MVNATETFGGFRLVRSNGGEFVRMETAVSVQVQFGQNRGIAAGTTSARLDKVKKCDVGRGLKLEERHKTSWQVKAKNPATIRRRNGWIASRKFRPTTQLGRLPDCGAAEEIRFRRCPKLRGRSGDVDLKFAEGQREGAPGQGILSG